jgi:spermidine/putrescine transport system ATP-binding protein
MYNPSDIHITPMDFGKAAVTVVDLSKRFGGASVLEKINFSVDQDEIVVLLGASGSGKTTILRIIAGLEMQDSGMVVLHGRNVTDVPARERGTGVIFQSYALFPKMTVEKNIGYGLKIRKRKRKEIKEKVNELLSLVQLEEHRKKYPSQLSGGQQQRVALARAIVNRPAVLLLDEPLGALDLKLRRQMQIELKRIQTEVGLTFVHVTHDQEEAMTMADTIAVMNGGHI